MRFAIAGISHETNTYCRDQTTADDFHLLRGAKLLQTSTQHAAIITADPPGLTTHRIEVFPRQKSPGPLWPIDDNIRFTLQEDRCCCKG